VVATAALLTLSGTASAVAADRPVSGTDTTTQETGKRQGPKCDRLDHVINGLERAKSNLQKKMARVQAKIASGDLSEAQLARARAFLARLEKRLAKVEALIERLGTKFEQKCVAQDD
jgi:predicted RNase H-like nuclease (RuvC/YqgF family)